MMQYIYIYIQLVCGYFFFFAINSHNLSLKSSDSKSLNTAVCSRRSSCPLLDFFLFFFLLSFSFFFLRNHRFVKSQSTANLYFNRNSGILLLDTARYSFRKLGFNRIYRIKNSKRSIFTYFFLFFSPLSPSHTRNLSSPLKH